MPLKPGTVNSTAAYSESMAAAMEEALRRHWPEVMPYPTIPFDDRFLKVFFVAIAQGVVKHLEEHPQSFNVAATVDDHATATGTVSVIDTDGVDPPADHFGPHP